MAIGISGDDFSYQTMILLRIIALMQVQGLGVPDEINAMLQDPSIIQTKLVQPQL